MQLKLNRDDLRDKILACFIGKNIVDTLGEPFEAMAVYGSELVVPAYYEQALQNKYLRDDYSVQMLDFIRSGRTVDLGYYNKQFTGTMANLPKTVADDPSKSFTVAYESQRASVEAMI